MNGILKLALACAVAFGAGYGGGLATTGAEPAGTPAAAPAGTGPHYVEIGQLVVPVMDAGRTTSFVLAQITVEAAGETAAQQLRRELPHARNALLQGLYGLAADGFFEGTSVDPAEASRRLAEAAGRRFGPDVVKEVLFDRLLKQDNRRG
jgi:flagellar FliL protein